MKRIVTIFLLLLTSQYLFAGDNEEFRATWVVDGQWISSASNPNVNKALAIEVLDNHLKANMNALLLQIRRFGNVYYNSSIETWGNAVGFKNPGYDPLAFVVNEAHKKGLEIHAYFNVFENRRSYIGSPAQKFPDWVCRDRDGNAMPPEIAWLSPGLENVRNYLIKLAMEIVRNYDIDGLHLDYVRWNDESSTLLSSHLANSKSNESLLDGMITDDKIEALTIDMASRYLYDIEHPYSAGVPQGFSSWEDWWRWSVTEFVRVLHDSIQSVKPWVRLSPAALGRYNWDLGIGWDGYNTVFQEAALWFNEGYIDQLTPMHYHWKTGSEFYGMLVGNSPDCWFDFIKKGVNDGRLFSAGPGSYILEENKIWYRHPDIVAAVRTIPWVDGFQFFSYGSWNGNEYWDEAGATFFNRKTKIRPTKLIQSTSPDAPTISILMLDSLNYQFTVTPPASIAADQRFAIYRSPDDSFDLDQDEIIDIHFGKNSYSFTDQFNGLQDYNRTYYYAATTLDRYWNESEISNTVMSDAIPSFAPIVVFTSPVEGDTIPVNASVTLSFSKTMEPNSVAGAISISPSVEINQLIWKDANKSVTIDVKGNFAFATKYTVSIGALAQDVNGRSIDGNGDGIAGDPFVLSFRTRDVDNVGPVIVSTYPDFQTSIEAFGVDEVITLVFDELIDLTTVLDTTLVLTKNGEAIKTQAMVTAVADRSLIDLKAYEPLAPGSDYSLLLRNTIADTTGNPMATGFEFSLQTAMEYYTEMKLIDNFTNTGFWEQPGYSGSTSGIVVANTLFGYAKEIYLPGSATAPVHRRSAFISYQWADTPPEGGYLLREYLSGGAPRDVTFDNSHILQCYVYGDGSRNKFRFSLREVGGQGYPLEVSKWTTIDWYGWRLIEWDLSDPNSVGTWLGNEIMDGSSYYVDSFQLTHDNTGAISGRIYVDNLRAVKKSFEPVNVTETTAPIVSSFRLMQNYPNPFNPTTTIPFDLPKQGKVKAVVYDLLGRSIITLLDGNLAAGHHKIDFDGNQLASGIYFYRLEFDGKVQTKQMILVK